ncbi:trans-aconitate 2-methyltransferase [Microlunatus sagamiharensis]|uniref:Trans-aconitate 2-methyltransferase n=1 Tax=Microlunatus sagamiharensis TaxID=546874 RepID=A0A1H2LVF6_9ACTN|nr:methyltransferase domain-containing protein [Microlunatus sagamiharensis]SDU84929.1 trans-aconitate 2-methyltransferase [Microlunatus sagamiharensis]
MPSWDAEVYSAFADERSRPFADLLARVGAVAPERVVDLGCGPGPLTAGLARRWPDAEVTGVDSSRAMIEAAEPHRGPRVGFVLADLADLPAWRPPHPVDVVVSNAALQWVPGHRGLLPGLVGCLAEDGWLAFQVPGNHDAPSHRALRAVAAEEPFAGHPAGVTRTAVAEPADYLADLAGLGCRVDAWETTYLHVLTGPDPVLRWLQGTGARPYLDALPEDLRPAFTEALGARLREAYPPTGVGTVLPFRRLFVAAQRSPGPAGAGS